ncbi:mitogen-activated protein kinase kinase kinase 15, partial [Striga asiatica]
MGTGSRPWPEMKDSTAAIYKIATPNFSETSVKSNRIRIPRRTEFELWSELGVRFLGEPIRELPRWTRSWAKSQYIVLTISFEEIRSYVLSFEASHWQGIDAPNLLLQPSSV